MLHKEEARRSEQENDRMILQEDESTAVGRRLDKGAQGRGDRSRGR